MLGRCVALGAVGDGVAMGDGSGRFSRKSRQRFLILPVRAVSGIAICGTVAHVAKQDPPWSFGHDGSVVVVPGVCRVPHPFRVLRLPANRLVDHASIRPSLIVEWNG